jgi:hypothetical protein
MKGHLSHSCNHFLHPLCSQHAQNELNEEALELSDQSWSGLTTTKVAKHKISRKHSQHIRSAYMFIVFHHSNARNQICCLRYDRQSQPLYERACEERSASENPHK